MTKFSRTTMATAMFLSLVGMACHHSTRPPVSSVTAPPATPVPSGSRTGESLDSGPDVRPLGSEGLSGRDLRDDTGEGGPLADVRFDFHSSALTATAQQLLSAHATWLKDNPRRHVSVEGHCDERGTVEYNLALGEQRARAVSDYLVNLGVPATQLQNVSYGKERPLDAGHTEEAWAKNRRVHFAVAALR